MPCACYILTNKQSGHSFSICINVISYLLVSVNRVFEPHFNVSLHLFVFSHKSSLIFHLFQFFAFSNENGRHILVRQLVYMQFQCVGCMCQRWLKLKSKMSVLKKELHIHELYAWPIK